MGGLLVRRGLLAELRRRHRLRLIVLEAPAGYGRTTLLRQAVADGRSDHNRNAVDVFHACGAKDAEPGRLACALLDALGEGRSGPAGDLGALKAPELAAQAVADALENRKGQTALIFDDIDGAAEEGAALCVELLVRLPEHAHLVVSGRRVPRLGVVGRIAARTAIRLGAEELALRPHEVAELSTQLGVAAPADLELAAWPALAGLVMSHQSHLVPDYLAETVVADLDPVVAQALAAVAEVGGCRGELLGDLLGTVADRRCRQALDGPAGGMGAKDAAWVGRQLALVPLVEAAGDGWWPHPIWASATRDLLNDAQRRRLIATKARSQADRGEVSDAGRLALRAGDPATLAEVVRAALRTQPPSASLADLQRWLASGLLSPGAAERSWLAGVIGAQIGDTGTSSRDQLERARRGFEEAGDTEAEVGVLLHFGTLARARNDLGELARLLQRAQTITLDGHPVAIALVALGRAIAAQLAGQPERAVDALDDVPPGTLTGDWAAQELMVRGTNLMLAGQLEPAIVVLGHATGAGSPSSRAIANQLLATARWSAGDVVGTFHDADTAERLAIEHGYPLQVQTVQALKATWLAASGETARAEDTLARLRPGLPVRPAPVGETEVLMSVADVLLAANGGDNDRARTLLAQLPPLVERPVRSTVWRTALDAALRPDARPAWAALAERHTALRRALAAGDAAARHLAGGPPVERRHAPFLPARWCATGAAPLTIRFIGGAELRQGFGLQDPPSWTRGRVRELCLHLAVVADRGRSGVAAALWPDLNDGAANANLRVTLSHLLDALASGRGRGVVPAVLIDRDGRLAFRRDAGLSIDLWDVEHHIHAILGQNRGADQPVPVTLAHARHLLDSGAGPILGGAPIGEWFEPHRRRLDDLLLQALTEGARRALDAQDHDLAAALAQRAIDVDPWSERGHQLLVRARLAAGDVDGARRALLETVERLTELGVVPEPATIELARQVGLSRRLARLTPG